MKKISELEEIGTRTIHLLDKDGNNLNDTKEYTVFRPEDDATCK